MPDDRFTGHEINELKKKNDELQAELDRIKAENEILKKKLKGYVRTLDEALNTGKGVYKP